MAGIGVGLFILVWVAMMVALVGGLVLWIYSIIEIVQLPDHAFRMAGKEKTTWVLIVVLVQMIGAVIWWFAARNDVMAAAAAAPYPPMQAYGPPPGWYPDPSGNGGQAWRDGQRWAGPPP